MSDLKTMLDDLDIRDYLDTQGIEYKTSRSRKGTQLILKDCPVCGGDGWKVYLNEETGLGNCFQGDHPPGENFNKWSFIRAHLDNPAPRMVIEHIEGYLDSVGFTIERERKVATYEALSELPEDAVALPTPSGQIVSYLHDRGVTAKQCEYFRLHFCERGVFRFKTDSREHSQDFTGRVIIPVFDLAGDFKTFQGRDITGTADDKYRFATGLPAAGAFLYNGNNAVGKRHVVVGEGAFDVWAIQKTLWSRELDEIEAVGTFGKHLSHLSAGDDDQLGAFLNLKAAGLETITMLWDSETAAIRDALGACDLLQQHGFKTRLATLPPGQDPGESTEIQINQAIIKAQPYSRSLATKMRLQMLHSR